MKKIYILFLIFFSISIFSEESKKESSSGGAGKFGLGITLFGPTGITGKYLLDDKKSIEGSIGLGTIGNGRTHLHGVFLYNFHDLAESTSLYIGGGLVFQERKNNKGGNGIGRGKFLNNSDSYESSLGIRVPIGISWRNPDKKFELSGEVYMNLFVTGKDGIDLGLALAGRYYF